MRFKKTGIVVSPYKYYNQKRLEEVETMDNKTGRKTVVVYSEIAEVDLRDMRKVKDPAIMNAMIDLIPEGARREIFASIFKGNRQNVVFDTTKMKKSVVSYYAKGWNITEEGVRKALRYFINTKWIHRLNKFQYMINPYYITRNDISMKKISELQAYWDRLEKDNIKVPITFSTEDVDDLVKQDLTKIAENIDKRQVDVARTKALKAKQIAEDTMLVSQHKEALKAIFDSFITYNKYDKIDTKVRVHFKSYLKKLFDNESYLVSEIPTLYLTSIKPLKQLEG